MKKVKNIYYAETPEERKELGGTCVTGLVIELEDGRRFRAQSTDVIMSFEEIPPSHQEEEQERNEGESDH